MNAKFRRYAPFVGLSLGIVIALAAIGLGCVISAVLEVLAK